MNYHHAKFQENPLKKKSYRSLKLHFFQKKAEKRTKTQIISFGINNFK